MRKKRLREWYEGLPEVSWETIQRAKEQARMRDWERIRKGEATPEQIQRENSIFTPEEMRTFRLMNLEDMLLRSR